MQTLDFSVQFNTDFDTEGVDELLTVLRLRWAKLVLRKHCKSPSPSTPRTRKTAKKRKKRSSFLSVRPTRRSSVTKRKKTRKRTRKRQQNRTHNRLLKNSTPAPSTKTTPDPAVHAIFLDIRKAFDRVWHTGLLYKLYGRC